MNNRRRRWLFLAGFLWLTAAAPAQTPAPGSVSVDGRTDVSPSHKPVPPDPRFGQADVLRNLLRDEKELAEQLRKAEELFGKDPEKLRELQEQLRDPKRLQELLDKLRAGGIDLDRLRDIARRQGAFPGRLGPDSPEMQKLLERLRKSPPDVPSDDPNKNDGPHSPDKGDTPRPVTPPDNRPPVPDVPRDRDPGAPPPVSPPLPDGGTPPSAAELRQRARFFKFAERLAESLKDSDTLRNSKAVGGLLNRLEDFRAGNRDAWVEGLGKRVTALGERYPRLAESFNLDRLMSRGWPRLGGPTLPPPRLPTFAPPSVGVSEVPSAGGEQAGRALLWLLVAAAAGFVLWKLFGRRLGFLVGRVVGRGLGPWPVRPQDVRTRDDVVRAFEYLALLNLGDPARSQNHRAIASRLGGDGLGAAPERRGAAERLADLYEQARYAPAGELPAEDDLAAARRDLTFLARAQAA